MKKYVWFQFRKENEYKSQLDKLAEHNIDSIIVNGNPDNEFLNYAKATGMDVHLWYITVLKNDKKLIEEHPDWFVINAKGQSCIENPPYVGYYRWLCISKPEVRKYIIEQILELADKNVDGIHLDYIRYPDVFLPIELQKKYDIVQDKIYSEYDFCYCDDCLEEFEKEYKIKANQVEHFKRSPIWSRFRQKNVNNLVSEIETQVRRKKKTISAAVFPTPKIARKNVRQSWSDWNLDLYFPMLYHHFYAKTPEWIIEKTAENIYSIAKSQMVPGIFMGEISKTDLENLYDKLEKLQVAGIAFFDASMMKKEHFDFLKNIR